MAPTVQSSRAKNIHVLIAADHVVMRAGLVQAVTSQPDMAVIAEVESGEQALDACRAHRPDVAIIDFRIPDIGGRSITRILREAFPGPRLVVFSNDPRREVVEAALAAGADGFVGQNISLALLVQAIRQVQAGERYLPPEFATCALEARAPIAGPNAVRGPDTRARRRAIARRHAGQSRATLRLSAAITPRPAAS